MSVDILPGDCLETLKGLPAGIVQTCVTSPPYYGLRDYGVDGQIGLEETPEAYVDKLVQVFREVWRVLKDDGTLWLNLGDSYAGSGGAGGDYSTGGLKEGQPKWKSNFEIDRTKRTASRWGGGNIPASGYLKPKNLIGIPWRVAFALQADGWWLRSDIIWHKPNPMPESVTDRPTKSHEYIFLLSKSAQYYYDAEAIMEPVTGTTHARVSQNVAAQIGSFRANGGAKTNGPMKAVIRTPKQQPAGSGIKNNDSFNNALVLPVDMRNKRSVWTVSTKPYSGAHFATFPPDLIEPCILAGSKAGDTVLDPFGGSGTTGAVSVKHHRNAILCELNPAYIELTRKRLNQVQPVLMVHP